MSEYPRETVEFQEVHINLSGNEITTFQVALIPHGQRPTSWSEPVELDGRYGVMVGGLTPGLYRIWARVSDNPETVVIDCGIIEIN